MYPYIVCFCGQSLGDIYELFKELRRRKIKAHLEKLGYDVLPELFQFSDDVDVSAGDILDKLHVKQQCCRGRLLTQVEYKEYY